MQDTNIKVLADTTRSGKDRHWRERKKQSLSLSVAFSDCFIDTIMEYGYTEEEAVKLADAMEDMYINHTWRRKRDATSRCATDLDFVRTENGKLKLYQAWFCKDRLCPMCNWRRAMKLTTQIAQMLDAMQKKGITGRPIFLTLTMRNVKGGDISKSFSDFAKAFKRLMEYKAVKDWCLGAIRTSEITYNGSRDDYNTHIHCLLWFKPGYFKGGAYLSHEKWTALWKKAARLDYTPVVNVKAIKPKTPTENDTTGYFAAVLEVAKYPVKPDAFVKFTDAPDSETPEQKQARLQHIKDLEQGMYKKRLISFFGIFKAIHKELHLDDTEDGDLVNADGDEDTEDKTITVERYTWGDNGGGNFYYTSTETIKQERNKDHHTRG